MTADPRPLAVHVTFALDFGGVEKHLETIARARRSIYRHAFVALNRGGAAERAIRATGAELHVLGCKGVVGDPQTSWTLARLLRRLRPAVVHGHGLEPNFHGLVAGRLVGVRARVAEEIGIPDRSPGARTVMRQVFRLAHRVVGISDAVAAWLVEAGEVPASKITRVYNPVLLPSARARPRAPGEPLRIGFVGRLDPVKNPMALAHAVARLLGEGVNCELLFVGDGSDRLALEAEARRAGTEGRIQILGFLPRPEEVLATCHVYVQPSFKEGFGIALVEAMACGLAPIVTRTGGMPEIVEDGATGWIVAEPTADALAQALRHVAALDPAVLASIGQAAAESVAGRFEPARYMEEIEALYTRILER